MIMKISGNTLKKLLRKAKKEGFAIPQFNYSDIWDFKAIIEAAEQEKAPVIIAAIPKVIEAIDLEICVSMGVSAMKKALVPVVHHLDHSTKIEFCKRAVDLGYPSVMIDASMLPLNENIRTVKKVVDYAHKSGIHVEAEIGKIPAGGDEGAEGVGDALVDPVEAALLVKQTGVDSLAIGIGTAHGFYKKAPKIDFDRLKRTRELINLPLVLHGGTGVPYEDVQRAIKEGISKVNIGTIIRNTYLTALGGALKNMERAVHTVDIQAMIRPLIVKVVREWIQVCMASGKAE
jgi:ketose-bisphosphate aldolase